MSMTAIDNQHEQLVSMVNQLMDEREILYRENEYLKAKLNESILIETIQEMKKERIFLLKLLSNLTINNNQDDQSRYVKHHIKENNTDFLPPPSYQTYSSKPVHYDNSLAEQNSTISRNNPSVINNRNRIYRLNTNIEQQKQQQQQQPTVIYRIDNSKENLMNNSDRLSSSLSSTNHMKHPQSNKKVFVYKTSITPQTQESNKLIRKYDCQLKHSQNSPFRHYRSQSLQDLT
ncbi:unnamed protein product [Rotaria sordida]|uniref:Uncharacterized protein n=2 Tax=Rotaria sordida TaxID=392033 RepID=A0A818YTX3_9BILA|nr:unnamed protein product [Rotaria sordida]CAF1280751.1 unnamed protein product [Rotaria sordida]CAF1283077.1 unnamed protein product [Rotaria sordida]CAF1353350.1 unnamed protein product [Rotaria sordida]CAF1487665.1 unnamed protein product [Rotaria sordida]